MTRWPKVKLQELLRPADIAVPVRQGDRYPNFGIYSFGRGLFEKPPIDGMATSATTLRRVRAGNFIYSRLFAFEGSYGIVDEEFDGYFVSNEYPSFEIDRHRLEPAFLKAYFQTPFVWEAVAKGSKGVGSRRIRVQPDQVLQCQVPLPSIDEQKVIARRLEALDDNTRQITLRLEAVEGSAERLLRSYVFHSYGDHIPKKPMSALVTLRKPDVVVDRLVRYQFAGVYSFGKGVFASANKAGSEFAYDLLSTVRAGDFTYPKLMAWEGGLGVVPPECDGMVVSPEFPVFSVDTSKILPEVLDVYFRTPEVWPTLAEISGGTNMRRRRLQPSAFLSYEMPVPPMATQIKIKELHKRVRTLKDKHAAIHAASRALLPATRERLFSVAT